jgi:hypothetical protein
LLSLWYCVAAVLNVGIECSSLRADARLQQRLRTSVSLDDGDKRNSEEHWTVSMAAMYKELQNCKNEAGRHWEEATSLRNESRLRLVSSMPFRVCLKLIEVAIDCRVPSSLGEGRRPVCRLLMMRRGVGGEPGGCCGPNGAGSFEDRGTRGKLPTFLPNEGRI